MVEEVLIERDEEIKPKTPAQLKKEAIKAEKLNKFYAKQKKLADQKETKSSNKEKSDAKVEKNCNYIFTHESGEKKDVQVELPSAYSPNYVEAAWYEWWEQKGFFKPDFRRKLSEIDQSDTFTIVIPPPNVTGSLHLGHALATTVEDTLCRWQRMRGKCVLYNPGCDHAGIATQVVVEKKLKAEKGLSRHDLGREKFIEEVLNWKNEKGIIIYDQFRKLGASVDWDRACFMLDPKIIRAVTEAFILMHENNIIYRSNRLVNWSCALRSAISDIEVDKVELTGRTLLSVPGYKDKVEFGVLVSFAYMVEDSDEKLVVATTRVETMLGDSAIAVHPEDERYKHLIGKRLDSLEFVLKVLEKKCVRKDVTVKNIQSLGAVKITPAHDHNDFEVGVRHNLPFITCISDDGTMNDNCGQFKRLKRFEARLAVTEALKERGLYVDTKDNPMFIPFCSRSKDVIEPILKAQWYVKCDVMAQRAIEAVSSGALKIIPDFHVATWNRWLESCRDWCISRQLWWGHRIPAYFITVHDENVPQGDPNSDDGHHWVSARTEEEAYEKAAKRFGVSRDKISLKWDEDVLDTWFSSGMWPFCIFGWPSETKDLKTFFPGTILETGHDILFFWVARMVFMSQELTGELPFKEVYLHAMIRDAHGRKMSKSLGNVIDPVDVIHGISLSDLNKKLDQGNLDARELKNAKEGQCRDYPKGIPECGVDALRFALMSYTSQCRNINLDVLRVQGYRFFCNKIWQACKFTLMQLDKPIGSVRSFAVPNACSLLDKWILSRLCFLVKSCNSGFSNYDFSMVTTALHRFWLYEFCDIYIEGCKPVLFSNDEEGKSAVRCVLYECVDTALRLIAPLMPFISEELWQRFNCKIERHKDESICIAKYPSVEEYAYENQQLEDDVNFVMDIVKTVRSLRSDYELTPKMKADLYIKFLNDDELKAASALELLIATLASANKVVMAKMDSSLSAPKQCAQITISAKCKIILALEGVLDFEKETLKLNAKCSKLTSQIEKLREQMASADYEEKVPLGIRSNNAEKLESLNTELGHLHDALAALSSS